MELRGFVEVRSLLQVITRRTTTLPRAAGILLLLLCFVFAGEDAARANPTVSVLATDPPGSDIVLGTNENFSLHLRYESAQPVRIWAQPYFQDKPVDAGSNPSREYTAGTGEAIGWFFLFDADAQVDEVRIRAGDGSVQGTPVVATYPIRITGSRGSPEKRPPADWVARLLAVDAAAQREDSERRMNAPVTPEDTAIISGFLLAVVGLGLLGFAAPAWGIWKWRGGWRIAAALPAGMMAFVVLRIVVDGAIDPTSHNLWPFEILMAGAMSAGFVFVAALLRRITGANRDD